jgi:hypothetical protein
MKTNDYPIFVSNQILTSSHLNQLRIYLDEENRLTRTKLAGQGIVCGLEVDYMAGARKVVVTGGYGISSDGFLMLHDETVEYTRYRDYIDPSEPSYPAWIKSNKQIKLLELFPKDTDVEGTKTLATLRVSELNQKVAVLYLERDDEELKTCTGSDCDHKGKERVLTPRVLLVNKTDLDQILLNDIIVRKDELPEIKLQRLHAALQELTSPVKLQNISSYSQLAKGYLKIVDAYKIKLSEAILKAHSAYAEFLGLTDYKLQAVADLKTRVFPAEAVQYAYDFLKDLVLAYDEFKEMAYQLLKSCHLDFLPFSRHLMLGKLRHAALHQPETYRHYMINAPLTDLQDELTLKAQWLFQRLIMLIEGFHLTSAPAKEIKIIPSDAGDHPLSLRAIPYYYKDADGLSRVWNPDLSFKGKTKLNLSYNEDQYNHTPQIPEVKTPLNFDISAASFLRIEGHLGHGYREVIKELQKKKESHNLPFEIVPLKLSTASGTVELADNCFFKDLQTAYLEYRNEFFCMLGRLKAELQKISDQKVALEYVKFMDAKFIKHLDGYKALLPECLDNFDLSKFISGYQFFIQTLIEYKLSMKHFLGKLIHEKIEVMAPEDFQTTQNFIQSAINSTTQTVDSCIYAKFVTVYHTYLWRLAYLKSNHLSIFSNFVRQHTGIEHLAGVPKGGTFIVVYHENTGASSNQTKVVADFALPYAMGCDCCEIPVCDTEPGADKLKLPPIARNDGAETVQKAAVTIPFMRNDYGFDEDRLTYVSHQTKSEKGGEVQFKEAPNKEPTFIYTPLATFLGIDRFAYTIGSEESGMKSTATVTILVRPNYIKHILAEDDFAATDKKKPLLIDVMENDIFYPTTQLRLLPSRGIGPQTTKLKATIRVVTENEKQLIEYLPGNDGEDYFEYILLDTKRKEDAIAAVSVVVYCCEKEGSVECELKDFRLTVFQDKPVTIDFNKEAPHVVVQKVATVSAEIAEVKLRDSKHIDIVPRKGLFTMPEFTFQYFGVDTRTDKACDANITLVPAPRGDIIVDRNIGRLDTLATSTHYKAVIARDSQLSANVEGSRSFVETVSKEFAENTATLKAGKRNNNIMAAFKKGNDPIFEDIRATDEKIRLSGTTPELKKRIEINRELLSANLDTFLATLGTIDKDLSKNSNVYKYLDTELKSELKTIANTGTIAIEDNLTKMTTEYAAKKNYKLALNNLTTP